MRTPHLVVAVAPILLSLLSVQAQSSSFMGAPLASQTYQNPALGLSFRYPAALTKETAAGVSPFERSIFALHAEADPAHIGADPCSPVVLTLGSGLDLPAETPTGKGKPSLVTPKGTLTLTEVKRDCLDKETLDDTILAGLVSQTEKLDGMRPLSKTTNSYIQGSTVWWSSSAGFMKDAKGKRSASAGVTILGSAGAVVQGHILLWSITANSPEMFNRLLDLSVCFDAPNCSTGFSRLVDFKLATRPSSSETASR